MAIGTEQSQVAQAIVVTPTIDVIQLERNGRSIPSTRTACFALGMLEACLDEPSLQGPCLAEATVNQELLERCCRHNRLSITASPALAREMRRIKAKVLDLHLEICLYSATGAVSDPPEDVSKRMRYLNGMADLVV